MLRQISLYGGRKIIRVTLWGFGEPLLPMLPLYVSWPMAFHSSIMFSSQPIF